MSARRRVAFAVFTDTDEYLAQYLGARCAPIPPDKLNDALRTGDDDLLLAIAGVKRPRMRAHSGADGRRVLIEVGSDTVAALDDECTYDAVALLFGARHDARRQGGWHRRGPACVATRSGPCWSAWVTAWNAELGGQITLQVKSALLSL